MTYDFENHFLHQTHPPRSKKVRSIKLLLQNERLKEKRNHKKEQDQLSEYVTWTSREIPYFKKHKIGFQI